MNFRNYRSDDQSACLAVFDSNTPPFFDIKERTDFETFLEKQAHPFLVVENEMGQIIACGGFAFKREIAIAKLRWGMVMPTCQRQGVGRFLLLTRLSQLYEDPTLIAIRVDTSQHTYGFYEKFGFVRYDYLENGITPGLHLYRMELKLDAQQHAKIAESWARAKINAA